MLVVFISMFFLKNIFFLLKLLNKKVLFVKLFKIVTICKGKGYEKVIKRKKSYTKVPFTQF